MNLSLPQPFWFRVAHKCRRVESMPRSKGRLLDLGASHGVTDLSLLAGNSSWASVQAAWNDRGLGFTIEVREKIGEISPEPGRPSGNDAVQLWIDTRDTRTIHRATRFCHRFYITVVPGSERALNVEVSQKPIARALADPPMTLSGSVLNRAERINMGYRLELFFPAAALVGFDPDENRRLGFAFQVTDPDRGDVYSGIGREFPVGEDPSLWATLVLEDDS